MELRFRFVPIVLMAGGLLLLGIEAAVIRPMFVEQKSTLDFATSFVAIQLASFIAFTSMVNGLRFWRLASRTSAQDRWAMILMGLMAFALFVLLIAWVT